MADVADAVVAALAAPVAGVVPLIAARIPAGPAAELGRTGAPPDADLRQVAVGRRPGVAEHVGQSGLVAQSLPLDAAPLAVSGRRAGPGESPVIGALREAGTLVAERLLGTLELTVPQLDLTGAPDLLPYLGPPPVGAVAFAHSGHESQAVTAAALLDRLRPGCTGLTASLAGRLAGHRLVAPLLVVPPDAADEAAIAAAHGTAHLALAVAVASAVVGQARPPALRGGPAAAVVGVALGTAILMLRDTPMPAGYAAAQLDKARAEYLFPHHAAGSVPVAGHRFALVEGEVPGSAEFGSNGLVAVVPGGAVIRTGAAEGSMAVRLSVTEEPPPLDTRGWDEVVEVSWHADRGQASVTGPGEPGDPALCRATAPWPGDYRLRVHARGRDDADQEEYYELAVWPAPGAPAIVHKRFDLLGHRLRGEPEPDRPQPPEHAYRWLRHTGLDMAATVTVVTGSTAGAVLRAFGADPARPESLRAIEEEVLDTMADEPWVAVLDTGAAVLAVEYNGYRGADEDVLRRASASGRAASMFWNINALTRLSFAEGGQVLASFEPPPGDEDGGPAVAAALDGLDFDDYRDTAAKGLVAVERFTGHGITAPDLDRIEAADVAYRIASIG